MSKIKPYQDQKKDGYIIREFKSSISERRLMWHRDKCDRIIEPIHTTDWKFQYDNQVPIPLSKLFIPKETYHRLIKGTGNLTLSYKNRFGFKEQTTYKCFRGELNPLSF